MDVNHLDASILVNEGFCANPYKDTVGKWTFGEGRCLETSPLTGVEWKRLLDSNEISVTVTKAGSQYMVDEIVAACVAQCRNHLPNWGALDDVRQNAIIEFCYQCGSADALVKFGTLASLLAQGDWAGAAADVLTTRWAAQTPHRAERFNAMITSGEWPSG